MFSTVFDLNAISVCITTERDARHLVAARKKDVESLGELQDSRGSRAPCGEGQRTPRGDGQRTPRGERSHRQTSHTEERRIERSKELTLKPSG
jgi:hypothetical protein